MKALLDRVSITSHAGGDSTINLILQLFGGEGQGGGFTANGMATQASVPADGLASISSTTPDDRQLPEVEAVLNRAIDVIRERLREGYPREALTAFEGLLADLPAGSTPYVVFRLKSNIGHCHLQTGDKTSALEWFDMAYDSAPSEPKAMAIKALAMLGGRPPTASFVPDWSCEHSTLR